jgi:hypothetical protein
MLLQDPRGAQLVSERDSPRLTRSWPIQYDYETSKYLSQAVIADGQIFGSRL